MANLRKYLSAKGLLEIIQKSFVKIPDRGTTKKRIKKKQISQYDFLMSGLAVFNFKSPSLLQFDQKAREPTIAKNLKSLYKITEVPCDTQMRERLDVLVST